MDIILDTHIEPLWQQLLREEEKFSDVVAMVWFYDFLAREGAIGITRAIEQYEKCVVWHELGRRTLYCLRPTDQLWSFFSTFRSATSAELVAHVHEVFEPNDIEAVEDILSPRLFRMANS